MNEKQIQEILDNNIDWLNQAAAVEAEHGTEALYRLVMELGPDQARSLLFVLFLSYSKDRRRLRNWLSGPAEMN
jgi:hypothetical protein